jgi:AraC-like DNA-binding protein
MVSERCKTAVKAALKRQGLHFIVIDLGEVDVMEDITAEQRKKLNADLQRAGLELMDDKKAVLIEKIKNTIVEMVHYTGEVFKINFSEHISAKLNYDYTYLSNLFTEVQGITIEKYIISHKIERVKELIIYNEMSISEIAWKMNYSSVAHLSNQFKKETGLSPSHFKKMKVKMRSSIEEIGQNTVKKIGSQKIV